MDLNKNNNGRIITRVARSNIQGNRVHSFFAILTIVLAVSLVTGTALVKKGVDTETERILDKMQHVMYMNTSKTQMEKMAEDSRVEMMVPYKSGGEFKAGDVRMVPVYYESHKKGIATYTPAEGTVPKKKNEIAVDRRLMSALGRDAVIGEEIEIPFSDTDKETFKVTGYVDNEYETTRYAVYFSEEYADNGNALKKVPYTALVRLKDAKDMTISEFTSKIYSIASDYGIKRTDTNPNGKFEMSLQGNAGSAVIMVAALLILFAGAIVIYSIFYLSVAGRVQQIGQLMTIGMTQRQIKKMIAREGLMLGGAGIPIGIFTGGLFGYFIKPGGWSFSNFLLIAGLAAVFGIITVYASVRKPARLAAGVSPIEAARYLAGGEDDKDDRKPHRRLTPFRLALMEKRNNRKKHFLITMSLAVGGIMLMTGASYMSAWSVEDYSRQDEFKNCEYIIDFQYSAESNPEYYGITNYQMKDMLDNELRDEIAALPHVKEVRPVKNTMANMKLRQDNLLVNVYPVNAQEMEKVAVEKKENADVLNLKDNELVVLGTGAIEAGFAVEPIHVGDSVTLNWFNGTEHTKEMKIVGISKKLPNVNEMDSGIYISEDLMDRLWKDMNKTAEFRITVNNYKENGALTEKKLNEIISSHKELMLWTLRQRMLEDSAMAKNLTLQIYGLAIFIISFSILNMINTTVGTISTRKTELSMLASIGMEEKQILKMLRIEGVLSALPNIAITLLAGTAAGYGAVYLLKSLGAGYLKFRFPALIFLAYSICTILAPVIISALCIKSQNKRSLVERIRNDD